MGTEAQIAGIPVVSVIDFNSTNSYCVNECLSKRERFKYFYSPKTNDELFEIVKRASENRLAVSKDISGFNKFVRDRYGLQLSDEGGYDVTLPIDSMVDFVVDFINKNEKKMNKNNRLIGFGYTHLFGLNRFKFLGKMIAYVDRKSPIFLSRAVHSLLYFVIIYTYRILYSIRLIDRLRFNYL